MKILKIFVGGGELTVALANDEMASAALEALRGAWSSPADNVISIRNGTSDLDFRVAHLSAFHFYEAEPEKWREEYAETMKEAVAMEKRRLREGNEWRGEQ